MASEDRVNNREKLRELVMDVFLLDPAEFRFDLHRDDVDTWDSLGVVSLAVGVHETFGYHMTPDQAARVHGLEDLIALLERQGISFAATT